MFLCTSKSSHILLVVAIFIMTNLPYYDYTSRLQYLNSYWYVVFPYLVIIFILQVQITPKNPSAYSSLRSKRSLFKSASTEENSSKICHRDSTSTNDENKPSVACSSKQPTGKQHPYPRQGSNKIKPMQENINKIKPMQENICPGRKALVSLENKPTPLRPRPVRTEGTLPFGHIASAIKYPGHDEGQLPVVGPAIMGEDISPTKFSKVFRPFSKATKKQLRRL